MSDHMIPVRLSEVEMEILRRRAKKLKNTMQQHIRMAILFEAVTAGDGAAIKLLGQKVRGEFVKLLERFRITGDVAQID